MLSSMKTLLFILIFLFSVNVAHSQKRTIRGQVVDRKGGVPGVNVLIKGTIVGTTTDLEGKFTLEIPNGEEVTLAFSYIGPYLEKKIKVNQTYLEVDVRKWFGRNRKFYSLIGVSIPHPNSKLLPSISIGYIHPRFRYGLSGELNLLPIMNDIEKDSEYQLGLPIYGSIRAIGGIRAVFGGGYFWNITNSELRNDFKLIGGFLYRRNNFALDIRYYNGLVSQTEGQSTFSRNLNIGLRYYF